MKSIFYKADSRGHADHGWLKSWHSFSFGSYYNPDRMQFGALRVLNDDNVSAGMGFGKHPHDNMEIISIPLEGDLEHQDSTGTQQVIRAGDIQVMSAGSGIQHSEKNKNQDQPVKFLQIWVIPNKLNVAPRYDQQTFSKEQKQNKFATIIAPVGSPEGVTIYQDAWFSLGKLDKGTQINYEWHMQENGVYAFVLEGDVSINDAALNRRDGLGVTESTKLEIKANSEAELLLMEVPMM